MPIVLGYWPTKGLGAYIKLILNHLGTEYTEEVADFETYFQGEKANLGLDFPNLPYLKDGDLNVSEHRAIVHYIIMKSGQTSLKGNNAIEQTQAIQIEGVIDDIFYNGLFPAAYLSGDNYLEKMKELSEDTSSTSQKFKSLNDYLGDNEYFIGNHLTYVDIKVAYFVHFYEWIYGLAKLPDLVSKYPNLVNLKKRIYGLDTIKPFVESDAWKNVPWENKFFLKWGDL